MKTAISLPDSSFERVRFHAERLGISRSEFFVKAAERWADELDDANLTGAINSALEQIGSDDLDDTAPFVRQAATRLFVGQQDDRRSTPIDSS
jgi:hypothetical protein